MLKDQKGGGEGAKVVSTRQFVNERVSLPLHRAFSFLEGFNRNACDLEEIGSVRFDSEEAVEVCL
jgi:hypothetical protein